MAGKFPTCSWSEDAYTNWLTMNGVNIGGLTLNAEQKGYVGGGLMAGLGALQLLSGNIIGGATMAQGFGQIASTMQESYRHSLVPDTFKGNINAGDYLNASGRNGFYFYKMSITEEYARSIDNFFSIYGYKVNSPLYSNVSESNRRKNAVGNCTDGFCGDGGESLRRSTWQKI